ncbi:MAG: hypothetical protein QM730_10950 [Anaerolineales bacterium]
MKNPFDPKNESLSSFFNLQKRMLQKVQSSNVDDHIAEIVQMAFEEALASEKVTLDKTERKFLLQHITKLVLQDLLKKYN